MSRDDRPAPVVLVGASPAEAARLAGPGWVCVSPDAMDAGLPGVRDSVAVVVVGSEVRSPVPVVQRAHRLLPDAEVVVLATDVEDMRRRVTFAPAVPLELLVTTPDDPTLPATVRQLSAAAVRRRRHADALAAAARSAADAGGGSPAGQAAVGALLEHAPIGVLVAAPSGELLGWNRKAEGLLGLEPAHSGHPVDDVVPGAGTLIECAAAPLPGGAGAEPDALQLRITGDLDVEVSAVGSQTNQGRPVVLLLVADVTEHRAAERDRDRLLVSVELLSLVSELLIDTLDPGLSMTRLAAALAPSVADWVAIELLDEYGQTGALVLHHSAPDHAPVLRELEGLSSRRVCLTDLCRRAVRGERVILGSIDATERAVQVPEPDVRVLVERLGMTSALSVPVPGRAGVLGSLLLVRGQGREPLVEDDLALAVEVGRRAGIALDNARLYAGQRHLATELQQSLLTAPPALPFVDIAVRYVAAAEQAQVGGDWYDAFRHRDGDLVVVIGDVVGHDTRAAATMGQLRGLLRGIAFSTDADAADVLMSLDEAMDGLQLGTAATAVVARLARSSTDPGSLVARWSSAGHPPPVLLDPLGRARLLLPTGGRADLLLGVDPGRPRRTEQVTLPPGSALLMYTDGLVERRGTSLDEGSRALLATVEAHAQRDLEGLCDAVISELVPDASEDDVAVVAVRPRRPL